MAAEHTPRPWTIGTRKDGSRWLSIGSPVAGMHYQADIHCSEADASLITAAPDLLAMLKHAVHWHDQISADDVARYQAVIAQAEGKP